MHEDREQRAHNIETFLKWADESESGISDTALGVKSAEAPLLRILRRAGLMGGGALGGALLGSQFGGGPVGTGVGGGVGTGLGFLLDTVMDGRGATRRSEMAKKIIRNTDDHMKAFRDLKKRKREEKAEQIAQISEVFGVDPGDVELNIAQIQDDQPLRYRLRMKADQPEEARKAGWPAPEIELESPSQAQRAKEIWELAKRDAIRKSLVRTAYANLQGMEDYEEAVQRAKEVSEEFGDADLSDITPESLPSWFYPETLRMNPPDMDLLHPLIGYGATGAVGEDLTHHLLGGQVTPENEVVEPGIYS